jgi:hypothetical protein
VPDVIFDAYQAQTFAPREPLPLPGQSTRSPEFIKERTATAYTKAGCWMKLGR